MCWPLLRLWACLCAAFSLSHESILAISFSVSPSLVGRPLQSGLCVFNSFCFPLETQRAFVFGCAFFFNISVVCVFNVAVAFHFEATDIWRLFALVHIFVRTIRIENGRRYKRTILLIEISPEIHSSHNVEGKMKLAKSHWSILER